MKSRFPDSSILTLITQTDGNNEKILFIYLKTIPDLYPSSKIYWYDGVGKDGRPNNVWNRFSIKQWTACCKDSILDNLFESILSTRCLDINGRIVNLSFPPFVRSSNNIDTIKSRHETIFDTLKTENNISIPREFCQKENLQFLSSYKTGSIDIKPLLPLGIFEDNFIYDNLNEGIWGVKEYRTAYLTFRGVRKSSVKGIGSKEIVGFYQQNFNPNSNYVVKLKNEKGQEIGNSIIDIETGFFKMHLTEPTQRGRVDVLVDGIEEKAIDYALIQDIQISINIADCTFKDVYDRSFMITSENKKRPEKISCSTWQQNVYADSKEANRKLSDLFKSIFDYLGPEILIADPYFINNIKQDKTTKDFYLSHCQMAFINALIYSAIEKGISKFNVLGCSRAVNHLDIDETGVLTKIESMFENYNNYFRRLITKNKLDTYLPPSTILFRKTEEEFHNRYWFSLINQDGVGVLDKCVIITNSIGNVGELDIIPVTDNSQLRQITRKYTGLFNNSKIRLSI